MRFRQEHVDLLFDGPTTMRCHCRPCRAVASCWACHRGGLASGHSPARTGKATRASRRLIRTCKRRRQRHIIGTCQRLSQSPRHVGRLRAHKI
jgi:hypothetical protein